jgi:alpha-1,6-mannosyltransferase
MRIAEVAEFYSPTGGGVRSYIDRKFQATTARGHELFVIAPAAEDRFEPRSSGGVVWVRSPPMPMDANYRMFWRADPVFSRLSALEPDVVEASSPWRGAWIAAAWPGPAPRALFMHADPVATYPQRWLSPLVGPDRVDRLCSPYWAYLRRLSRRFHQVVAGGEWLAERLAANGIGNLRLISLGVERDVFSPARRDESLRRELLAACSLPASATLLLGVGRFHPEKRWPTVIEAVRRANRVAPMGLVLVGDGLDRANVLRAAGGDPRIHFRAPIRDRALMAALMASADALVHGGESETFGLAVAEAAASGAPLVVPDRGGCARLAHPASSETYRSGDVAEATAALLRLHARGPAALRTAAVRLASQARADTRHYAELFAEYEALSHPVAALAAACA